MLKYIIKKIIFTCIVLVGAATCAFLLLHAIPGDTAEALAGPQATVEDVDNLRRAMEQDQPLGKQYISYMGNLLHGDLGYSYRTNKPVMDILKSAWPATLQLAVCSMIVAVLLGVPIGIFAAIHRGKAGDTIAMIAAFLGVSMPSFWLALLLIIEFSVNHNWFPFYGREGISSFVLPSLTLGLGVAANIARLTRTSMLEVLGQDYIRTAKGKGVKSGKIIWVHALRNAAVPVVTIIGLQFGVLLGGQVVTETVFSWPGIGRMIVDALNTRDLQIVQGGILILAATFTIINLITDLVYALLDPRIRYS
ncbi:ABC transporter permease [Blautia producta]|uniref:ABC transporter permease n=1 Tax=Blautia producta TaxID=33035 RepID=UPI001D05D05A|nr:ABC transporter permease [Blautia producta]MCB6727236.1 ABC transporter permease [Blautia marasmi]MCQ5097411.1 ABC transporter permease [Blautia producta]